MDGFKKLVFRICPIIMLICFVCLGITHTFGATDENDQPLTYLSYTTEVVQADNPNTQNVDESITIRNYTLDYKSYTDAITTNSVLKDSLLNTIDLETFKKNIDQYNILWQDGYQFLDVSKSILNTFVLLINGFITITNVIIAPFRLAGAVLLTGMSLIGININRDKGIVKLLRTISLYAVIPLIGSQADKPDDILTGSTWYWKDSFSYDQNTYVVIDANFTSNDKLFTQIIIKFEPTAGGLTISYITADTHANMTIYRAGNWQYNSNYRKFTFNNNNFDNAKCNQLATLIRTYCYQMIDGTIWQFNSNLYNPFTNTYTFHFYALNSTGEYQKIIITANQGIWYQDNDGNQVQVYDSTTNTWIYEDSRTIRIAYMNEPITVSNQIWTFLTTYATKLSI